MSIEYEETTQKPQDSQVDCDGLEHVRPFGQTLSSWLRAVPPFLSGSMFPTVRTYRDVRSAHIVDTTENADQKRGFATRRIQ